MYPFETGKWYYALIPAGQARHQEVCSFFYFQSFNQIHNKIKHKICYSELLQCCSTGKIKYSS